MHVLIIPSWFKTPKHPTHAPFIEEQARMLQKANIKVGVIYPNWSGSFIEGWKKKRKKAFEVMIDDDLPIYYYNCHSIIPFISPINFWYLSKKIERIYMNYVKQYGEPDILHGHSIFLGGIVGKYLSKKFHKPFVLTEHASPMLTHPYKGFEGRAVQNIFNQTKHILCVSSFQKEKLAKIYNAPINNFEVIHNVVNPIFLDYDKNNLKIEEDYFNFVIVGGLREIKNHKLLINAFNKLQNVKSNVKLIIVGDGPLRMVLTAYVKELGLSPKIVFKGNLSREDVKCQIAQSHVLISTSKLETFGVNIIEALGLGKPVIATDSGGPRDIIREEDGVLVDHHSSDHLFDAMKSMIENYKNYDPSKISNGCRSRFSEEVIMAKLKYLYHKILD